MNICVRFYPQATITSRPRWRARPIIFYANKNRKKHKYLLRTNIYAIRLLQQGQQPHTADKYRAYTYHFPLKTPISVAHNDFCWHSYCFSLGVCRSVVYLSARVYTQTFVKWINSNIYICKFDLVCFIVLARERVFEQE